MRNLEILTDISHKYSFKELVLPLRDEMVAYASKLARGDEARAQDVVQDALIKALAHWDRWTPYDPNAVNHSVRAWLFRVVMHTFYKDHRAQKHRRQDALVAVDVHATPADLTHDILASGFCDEVQQAISDLSEERRQVIYMYYVRGMCCDQISQETGLPKNTVFTRLARARAQIAKKLAPVAPRLGLRQLRE